MNQTITIKKRNGDKEPLDIEKLHKVVEYACEGLTGVSASEVELKSHIQFYNNMTTKEIQETLIKAAADLISEESPNYQFVAGRLICYDLRKEVYNNFKPRSLYKQTKRIINVTPTMLIPAPPICLVASHPRKIFND